MLLACSLLFPVQSPAGAVRIFIRPPDSGARIYRKLQEAGMNRIIVNWMYPRSLTTVFMRAITNRGDFHTIFEPTLPLYWRNRNEPGVQSHQDYEGWPWP